MGTGIVQKLGLVKTVDLLKLKISYLKHNLVAKKVKNNDKVFVIGMNKTGTTSVYDALVEFGYKVPQQRLFEYSSRAVFKGKYIQTLTLCDYYEGFQDMPFSFPNTYKILLEKYPDAKFILTKRTSSLVWLKSMKRYYAKFCSSLNQYPSEKELKNCGYCYKGFIYDYLKNVFGGVCFDDSFIKIYEQHELDAIDYFKLKQKSNQLLVLNVEEDSSYNRLSSFLEKKALRKTFKHLNTSI